MECRFAPLAGPHRQAILDIFNHYVGSSFAAYPDEQAGDRFFDFLLEMARGYPAVAVETEGGEVAGFGLMRALLPFATLRRSAQLSYFLAPERTGQGIGGRLLAFFEAEALPLGVDTLFVNIASPNDGSLRFHRRHGFEECGRFVRAGRKFGRDFDLVWMQKRLPTS